LKPRRIHGFAHPSTHHAKCRKVRWIGQIFFSEDVSDNDIVWKTRDDDASLNIGVPLSRVNECSTPRGASTDIANGAVRARVVVVSPEKSNSCDFQVM